MTIERAFASADDTLDQTSDTLLNSMTLTPASGEYLAVFSGDFLVPTAPTDGDHVTFSIYVGGTQVTHSERLYEEEDGVTNTSIPITLTCEVNPNGSQAVEVRYRASAASSPCTFQRREFNLLPVTDNLEDTATGQDTLNTATWTTLGSMTRTPASGDYLLTFSTSAFGANVSTLGFRVSVGGTPIAASEVQLFQEASWDVRDFPIFLCASISPNGSQVVEVEWSSVGNNGQITANARTMNLTPTESTDIFQATGTAGDVDATTTDKLIDDMTITDPGVETYLTFLASSTFFGSISGTTTKYTVRVAGSQVADSLRQHTHEGSIDNTVIPVMLAARVTTTGSTDDLEAFWQGDSTQSRTMNTRTFIAIVEGTGGSAQTIVLNTVTLVSSAPNLNVIPGIVVVSTNSITLVGSVPNLVVVVGAISVALNVITLVGSVPSLVVVGALFVTLNVITLIGSAEIITIPIPPVLVAVSGLTLSSSVILITVEETATAAPDSDVSIGAWSDEGGGTTSIFQSIDEARNAISDADFIQSEVVPATSVYEAGLENISDPQVSNSHYIRYRYRRDVSSSHALDLTVRLKQGAGTIATWVHTSISTSYVTVTQELSTSEADSITDYNDLRLEFEASTQ